jgi:hypothetical protein
MDSYSQARGNIHFDREYESIYPVKIYITNMYYCRAINVEIYEGLIGEEEKKLSDENLISVIIKFDN